MSRPTSDGQRAGAPEVFKIEELPTPETKGGWVLITVAAINDFLEEKHIVFRPDTVKN